MLKRLSAKDPVGLGVDQQLEAHRLGVGLLAGKVAGVGVDDPVCSVRARRRFSFQPVVATCRPKTPTIAGSGFGRSLSRFGRSLDLLGLLGGELARDLAAGQLLALDVVADVVDDLRVGTASWCPRHRRSWRSRR